MLDNSPTLLYNKIGGEPRGTAAEQEMPTLSARSRKNPEEALRLSDFQKHLKDSTAKPGVQTEPKPIYVLAGADPYLVRQGRAAVRTHVFGDADPGMALVELDGADAQLAEVLDTLRTLPMLAPHRLVCVREADKFVSASRAALENYLDAPSPTGSLCLEVEKWNSGTKLGKRVADIGLVVQCEADRPRQIPVWLQRQAKERYGKTLSFAAAEMLREYLGTDMGSLVSALEMLDLYTGTASRIDTDDVDVLIARGHHERVWALCDAVAARRLPHAMALLDAFWAEGMAAPNIVGLLRVQLRQLARVCALGRHMSLDAAMARAGVPRWAASRLRRAVQTFSDAHLADAYQAMVDADLAAKTITGQGRLAMDTLVHRLCSPGQPETQPPWAPNEARSL